MFAMNWILCFSLLFCIYLLVKYGFSKMELIFFSILIVFFFFLGLCSVWQDCINLEFKKYILLLLDLNVQITSINSEILELNKELTLVEKDILTTPKTPFSVLYMFLSVVGGMKVINIPIQPSLETVFMLAGSYLIKYMIQYELLDIKRYNLCKKLLTKQILLEELLIKKIKVESFLISNKLIFYSLRNLDSTVIVCLLIFSFILSIFLVLLVRFLLKLKKIYYDKVDK